MGGLYEEGLDYVLLAVLTMCNVYMKLSPRKVGMTIRMSAF